MATRVISAILAALFVSGLAVYFGPAGMAFSCVLALILGTREFARMVFSRYKLPLACTPLYWFTSLGAFAVMLYVPIDAALVFAVANVIFFLGTLWSARGRVANDDLLPGLALGTFGMLYCSLFPLYGARVALGPHGLIWFGFMLLVVFAGDTFAYFAGRAFGARKFMPDVSPNKTWEGSIGGLIGSGVAGTLLLHFALPEVPRASTLAFSLGCGFSAQTGDLLISLVKRVVRVKDTGRLMPGHGGLLDRLDGVLIACPLVYAFSVWVG